MRRILLTLACLPVFLALWCIVSMGFYYTATFIVAVPVDRVLAAFVGFWGAGAMLATIGIAVINEDDR